MTTSPTEHKPAVGLIQNPQEGTLGLHTWPMCDRVCEVGTRIKFNFLGGAITASWCCSTRVAQLGDFMVEHPKNVNICQ